ncbi:MAG: tetratricopeptide repeat protein [Bacteriovoracaceae bacterium]|nr:tetratricopeptide repeat protein [Bacteriovoracaceae bacterium]
MKKYRIKLENGRVIGPFAKEQVGELYIKGHIYGQEDCQEFPAGKWQDLESFSELSELIVDIIAGKVSLEVLQDRQKTVFKKISIKKIHELPDSLKKEDKKFDLKEFDFDSDEEFNFESVDESKKDSELNLSKLFEAHKDDETTPSKEMVNPQHIEETHVEKDIGEIPSFDDEDDELNKTVINKSFENFPLKQNEEEKVEEDTPSIIEEVLEKAKTDGPSSEEQDDIAPAVSDTEISSDDHTVVGSLKDFKSDLIKKASKFEANLVRVEKKDRAEKKAKSETPQIAPPEEKKEVKKQKPIFKMAALLVVLAVIYQVFLGGEDKQKNFKPIFPDIAFPFPFEKPNPKAALKYLREGLELYKLGSYKHKALAARKFKDSLDNSFEKNKALGHLLLTYAELLENAKDREKANLKVYQLVEVSKGRVLTDQKIAMGSAIFFLKLGRPKAALKFLNDFLRVNSSSDIKAEDKAKISLKFYAVYLSVLIDLGEMADARKKLNGLEPIPDDKKSLEVYSSIVQFHLKNDDYNKAKDVIEKGLKYFPWSVSLRLTLCQIYSYFEEYDLLNSELKRVKKLNSEFSVVYYAKYLEFMGILNAVKKEYKNAAVFFKAALKLRENDSLRSKLALLEESSEANSDPDIGALVKESKALDLIKKSKVEASNGNFNKALILALEAREGFPNYVPAIIYLSDLQIRRGFFDDAIETLIKAKKASKLNQHIIYALVRAYAESFKVSEAKKTLSILRETEHRNSYQFASALGHIYYKSNEFLQAVKWLRESTNLNPLNEKDFFKLGSLFLRYRRYDKAKILLWKAISLDPSNIKYQIAYSRILYELDSVDVAIGYLRDILKEYNDSGLILSQISIYYYKSGQVKAFEQYKERVMKSLHIGKDLFDFLIKASKLEDKKEEIIKNYEAYIKVEPGDLAKQLEFGEYLLSESDLTAAEKVFTKIETKLKSYPKVKFFLANIKLMSGKEDEALILAQEEIKLNPNIEYGYTLLGHIYTKKEEYNKALKNYKHAQTINQNSVDALLGLAWIKYQQNQIESALDLYEKCAKLDPNNSFVRKQLGYVYKALGQRQLAIESFKVYLDLSPDAPDRKKIESQLNSFQ